MLAGRRALRLDALLAAVLTALSLAALITRAGGPVPAHAYALAVLGAAPLAFRHVAPVTTTSVVLVAGVAYALQGFAGTLPNNGLGILLGIFTVAMLRTPPVAATVFGATVIALSAVTLTVSLRAWPQLVMSILAVVGAWVLGDRTRRWSRRAEDLAALAAVAAAAERVRIARELHDVVAHHMAVISLQAGVAEYVLDTDPTTAKQAISTVGASSRTALAEMRRLLAVLRTAGVDGPAAVHDATVTHDEAYRPPPGLASLPELADRVRAAGLPVTVQARGRLRDLPAGPDLTAYRVVQEALTNVVKHAGPASARVDLDFGVSTLTISVTDDGAGAPEREPPPDAQGLRGMRERVELFGGTLVAEPAAHGGFVVLAHLPIPVAR